MSKQKAVGTAFETLVLSKLWEIDPYAHRNPAMGSNDEGDIALPSCDFVVECKRVAKLNLAGWYAEAVAEAANAGKSYAIVVHKRARKGRPEDQWVTLTLGDFIGILHSKVPGL